MCGVCCVWSAGVGLEEEGSEESDEESGPDEDDILYKYFNR
jgi:hypothetical protein